MPPTRVLVTGGSGFTRGLAAIRASELGLNIAPVLAHTRSPTFVYRSRSAAVMVFADIWLPPGLALISGWAEPRTATGPRRL